MQRGRGKPALDHRGRGGGVLKEKWRVGEDEKREGALRVKRERDPLRKTENHRELFAEIPESVVAKVSNGDGEKNGVVRHKLKGKISPAREQFSNAKRDS